MVEQLPLRSSGHSRGYGIRFYLGIAHVRRTATVGIHIPMSATWEDEE